MEFRQRINHLLGKSKWGLSNLLQCAHNRPQLCTFVAFLGPFVKELSSQSDDNRRKSWTIVDKHLKPPCAKPPFRFSRIYASWNGISTRTKPSTKVANSEGNFRRANNKSTFEELPFSATIVVSRFGKTPVIISALTLLQ